MNYFIIQNGQQAGPFSVDQLRTMGITGTTPVWAPGFTDWTTAGAVAELQSIIAAGDCGGGTTAPPPYTQPPAYAAQQPYNGQQPYNQPYHNSNMPLCPKTWLAESILATILCCLPFGIVGIVYAAGVSSKYQMGDYEGAVRASKNAKTWTLVAFFTGLIVGIVYAVLVAVGTIALDNYHNW